MNVMSFNIRCDKSSDQQNSWQYRKDFAAQMILFYDVDILGTQEVFKCRKKRKFLVKPRA